MMTLITFRRFALVSVAGLAGLLLTMLQTGRTVSAAPPPPIPSPTPVLVTNSGAAQAVPINGTVDISGTPTVNLAPPSSPLPVYDVENPARSPYQQSLVLQFSNFDVVAPIGELNVPTGKVWVVELITALVQVPNGQKVKMIFFVNSGGTIIQHFFAPTLVGSDFTVDDLVFDQPVRLYAKGDGANGNYAIRVNATRFSSNLGTGSVQLSLAGYLVDE
jgi:hypothetical protein